MAPAAEHLRGFVEHHVWATLGLLDRCLELSPERLALSAPGTYGSIHETLAHLVGADGGYVRRLVGGKAGPRRQGAPPPVAALRAEMAAQAGLWQEVMDRPEEPDVYLPAEPDADPPYPEIEHAAGLLLLQAMTHGQEHRAHVCTILGMHGLDVPDLSAWEYVRLLTEGSRSGRR